MRELKIFGYLQMLAKLTPFQIAEGLYSYTSDQAAELLRQLELLHDLADPD